MNAIDLQDQLRKRSMERTIFAAKRLQSTDTAFEEIKERFTRGKHDTYFDIVKW